MKAVQVRDPALSCVSILQCSLCLAGAGPNLRAGGHAADLSVYIPASQPLPDHMLYRITETDFEAYTNAVPAWNGSLTLDLNFYNNGTNDSWAMNHLAAALAYESPAGVRLNDLSRFVELGNEPDL